MPPDRRVSITFSPRSHHSAYATHAYDRHGLACRNQQGRRCSLVVVRKHLGGWGSSVFNLRIYARTSLMSRQSARGPTQTPKRYVHGRGDSIAGDVVRVGLQCLSFSPRPDHQPNATSLPKLSAHKRSTGAFFRRAHTQQLFEFAWRTVQQTTNDDETAGMGHKAEAGRKLEQ